MPVEKAAPALSGPVGGSVSYVYVGDVSVSCEGDMELRGIDKVLLGAVSGRLCDLDRVSGSGDTDVSGVDTVVSGAVGVCLSDLDSVSPGDTVVRVGEMSLSRGGDAVVLGVAKPVIGVS